MSARVVLLGCSPWAMLGPMRPSPARPGNGESEVNAQATLLLRPEDRRVVRRCLFVLGALAVCMWTGTATAPYLVNNYPRLLIALSPVSRHVVLVVPLVGPWWVLLIGGLRHLAFTAFSYFLGRAIGEPGIVWLERRAKAAGRFVRFIERFFQRWGYFAVFVFPLGAMAAIAGMARMNPTAFFVVAIAGIVFRLGLLALLATRLHGPITTLLELIREWQGPATLACIALVAGYQFYKWYKREERDSPPYGLS
ncbi:MAG: hypothetical protein GY733_09580 [bacterium]|nr:hypothetical protein [bacterium]